MNKKLYVPPAKNFGGFEMKTKDFYEKRVRPFLPDDTIPWCALPILEKLKMWLLNIKGFRHE